MTHYVLGLLKTQASVRGLFPLTLLRKFKVKWRTVVKLNFRRPIYKKHLF